MGYRKDWSEIESICNARNGERCKDCVMYHNKECAKYKATHHNCKPCDNDPYKRAAQYEHFTMKEEKRHAHFNKEGNKERRNQD